MTVVLVDPRRPTLVPVEAVGLLGGEVAYTEELPDAMVRPLPSARPVQSDSVAPVLLSSARDHPAVVERLAAGEPLLCGPGAPAGDRLVDAVAMMDRLRTDGPWESEQTHDSLRRFLLEETYEFFDAIRGGDAGELCGELGDVLLQVLFHARIAQDAPVHSFGIDDVADTLLRKLTSRASTVLAGESISLEEQVAQWEERKTLERKRNNRNSVMDDVPTAQPALALARQVLRRAGNAGIPSDLVPAAMTSVIVTADIDVEGRLRTVVLDFMDTVRRVEDAALAVGGSGPISAQQWREYWPATPISESD